ncbi:MAG: UbiH/UbiF/VisC/COQ6 family ubiquinone biosynthesis hydroxylase [Burkholderia sp.]|nr:UbiH/UbiF/VisC/COQ6 family ubiquinone biosynthesis hydroxylase [Burkholderia sp.]
MITAPSVTEKLFDIAIIGAGPVGLSLASWLTCRNASQNWSIALIDARNLTASSNNPCAIALSHGSRVLLDTSAWPSDVTPIKQIHISQRGYFGRLLIEHDEYNLEALGYVVRYESLIDTLTRVVKRTSVQWFTLTSVCSVRQDDDSVTLSLKTEKIVHKLRAKIVVNAEGGLFNKQLVKKDRYNRNYQQTAIVGVVTVSTPRPNMAWERFTSEGPLALLPLNGLNQADYVLVWCCSSEKAIRRAVLPDNIFLLELSKAFGSKMGKFTKIIERTSFPLGLSVAKTLIDRRIIIIGNAAQTLHPVAGQGLNLGLRDAKTLADILLTYDQETELLSRLFNTRRALDRWFTIGSTDILARLFTISFGPLSVIRSAALTALEFLPPLKSVIAHQMIFGQRV